jgi:hypothetical protein
MPLKTLKYIQNKLVPYIVNRVKRKRVNKKYIDTLAKDYKESYGFEQVADAEAFLTHEYLEPNKVINFLDSDSKTKGAPVTVTFDLTEASTDEKTINNYETILTQLATLLTDVKKPQEFLNIIQNAIKIIQLNYSDTEGYMGATTNYVIEGFLNLLSLKNGWDSYTKVVNKSINKDELKIVYKKIIGLFVIYLQQLNQKTSHLQIDLNKKQTMLKLQFSKVVNLQECNFLKGNEIASSYVSDINCKANFGDYTNFYLTKSSLHMPLHRFNELNEKSQLANNQSKSSVDMYDDDDQVDQKNKEINKIASINVTKTNSYFDFFKDPFKFDEIKKRRKDTTPEKVFGRYLNNFISDFEIMAKRNPKLFNYFYENILSENLRETLKESGLSSTVTQKIRRIEDFLKSLTYTKYYNTLTKVIKTNADSNSSSSKKAKSQIIKKSIDEIDFDDYKTIQLLFALTSFMDITFYFPVKYASKHDPVTDIDKAVTEIIDDPNIFPNLSAVLNETSRYDLKVFLQESVEKELNNKQDIVDKNNDKQNIVDKNKPEEKLQVLDELHKESVENLINYFNSIERRTALQICDKYASAKQRTLYDKCRDVTMATLFLQKSDNEQREIIRKIIKDNYAQIRENKELIEYFVPFLLHDIKLKFQAKLLNKTKDFLQQVTVEDKKNIQRIDQIQKQVNDISEVLNDKVFTHYVQLKDNEDTKNGKSDTFQKKVNETNTKLEELNASLVEARNKLEHVPVDFSSPQTIERLSKVEVQKQFKKSIAIQTKQGIFSKIIDQYNYITSSYAIKSSDFLMKFNKRFLEKIQSHFDPNVKPNEVNKSFVYLINKEEYIKTHQIDEQLVN